MNGYPTFTVEQVDVAMKNHALAGMGIAVARQVLILGESVEEAAHVLGYPTDVGRRAVKALLSKIERIRSAYQAGADPSRMTHEQFYCCMVFGPDRTGPVIDAAYEVLVCGSKAKIAAQNNGLLDRRDPVRVSYKCRRILEKHHKFINAYGGHHEEVLP